MKKKLSILVALLLCFAMLAGCASNAEAPADDQTDDTATSDTTSDDGAASGDPIKIGMVAPVTGTSAMVGEYMENGFKLAADEINAEGGILGHPIELVLADEVDNAQSSVTGMQLLISEGDISAIIGSYYSAYAIAALPDVLDAQIPTLVCGSSSGVSKEKNPYAWQARPLDTAQGAAMASFVIDELGCSNPVLHQPGTGFPAGAVGAGHGGARRDRCRDQSVRTSRRRVQLRPLLCPDCRRWL